MHIYLHLIFYKDDVLPFCSSAEDHAGPARSSTPSAAPDAAQEPQTVLLAAEDHAGPARSTPDFGLCEVSPFFRGVLQGVGGGQPGQDRQGHEQDRQQQRDVPEGLLLAGDTRVPLLSSLAPAAAAAIRDV